MSATIDLVAYSEPPPMAPYSPPANRAPANRRGIVVLVLAIIVALVVAALAIGEVYVRHTIKQCIASQFTTLGADVNVGLSASPVLLQVLSGTLDYVSVDTKSETTGAVKGLTIDAKINGIDTSTGANKSSEAVIHWSKAGILSTLQAQSFGQLIESADTNSDGTLKIGLLGGLATATVKVSVENQTLKLEAVDAEVFGFGIPNDLVDNILSTLNDNLKSGDLPFGLKAQSVDMDSNGLTLHMAGKDWTPPAETASTPVTNSDGTTSTPSDQPQSVTSC